VASTNPVNLLRRLFNSPTFSDEKKNQQAFILHVLLVCLFILGILYLVASLLFSPQTSMVDLEISTAGILVTAFLLVLLRRGYVRLASMIQVASFWLLFTAIAVAQDGIFSPAYMMGYILVILIAGILLGGAGALVMTGLSLVTGLGIYYFQSTSAIPTNLNIPLIGYWITSAFMFPLCAILQYLASRLMQQALARAGENERKYHSILDAIQDVYYRCDLQGRLVMASPSFLTIFGYDSMDEVLGKSIAETFYEQPEDRQKFLRAINEQKEVTNYEEVLKRKDGTLFTAGTSSHFTYDESANITGIEGILRDITEMKRAEEQLLESEERYRSIGGVAFEGIMIERNGIILDANRKFAEIFGYADPQEVIGKNGLDFLLAPESSAKVQARLMVQPGIIYDVFGIRKDGTTFQGETQSREIIYRGKPAWGVTMRDVTDRIAVAAELRRLNRALQTISKCNEALVRSVNEQELLVEICRNIVEIGEYPLACIDLVDPGNHSGYCNEANQFSQAGGQTMRSGWENIPGMIGMVMAKHQPIFINLLSELQGEQTIGQFLKPGTCRSLAAIPLYYEETFFGVLSIFSGYENAFDPDEIRLITEMASDLSYGLLTQRVRADRKAFLDILQATNQELERSYDATLEGWSGALELRERDTAGHSQRVVEMTLAIARAMAVPESELIHIRRGALLHDIGKMGIPDRILLKPGPLTSDEWRTMRHHPLYAQKLLHGIAYLQPAFDIPYYHHERWDGQGYPNKLAGERIPIAARIFAVVDVWDALTSDRPYRLAWTADEALHYIVDQSGKQFDPLVVVEFTKILENYRQERSA
jgi:PAS domain S-box-containing protein